MNVLCVTDAPLLAELLARPLSPLGHRVSHVATMAEARQGLGELSPEVASSRGGSLTPTCPPPRASSPPQG
ncbi:MAG: response regulator transcription factor [Polyangiaceae bacterium]|nr:response regulator transcription factor [Polyangiaceae bacterium]